jgi:integrase
VAGGPPRTRRDPGTIHKARALLSSVLRHAAERDAIPGNPLLLVRPPKAGQRDAVQPLSPATVEAIRHALRLADVGEKTIHVQRAANPDGSLKPTKTERRRSVKLLSPLAQDLREWRIAAGRPSDSTLLLLSVEGRPWDKTTWQMWRADRGAPACRTAGLDPVPVPHALRHSFASLLLAEGKQPSWVAR